MEFTESTTHQDLVDFVENKVPVVISGDSAIIYLPDGVAIVLNYGDVLVKNGQSWAKQ